MTPSNEPQASLSERNIAAQEGGSKGKGPRSKYAFILWWAAFCAVQTLLVRLGTNVGYGPVAFLDEFGFAILLLGLFAFLAQRVNTRIGQGTLLVSASLLIVLAGGNQLYFDAFNNWAALYCLGQIGELGAVKSSIDSMLPYDVIVLWFLVPFALLFGVNRAWKSWQPRYGGWLLLIGTAFLWFGSIQRVNVTSPQENHFILRALRMEAIRQDERSADYDPEGILQGQDLAGIIPPMKGYERDAKGPYPMVQKPSAPQAPVRRPNIIIIEAESFRSAESGAYGADKSITPRFDALAKEGLLAKNFYATGMQTVRGELSILCSAYPAFGDLPLYKRKPKTDLTCLPDLLRATGYETHWFSAFRSTYSGKRAFLESHGFNHIHGVEEIGQEGDVHIGWGVSDEVMADRIIERLDKTPEPFMATWITLSNHHPWRWDYPMDFPEDLEVGPESEPYAFYRRGIHYTDYALGSTVEKIRSRPWGKDAWIVITGDHGMAMYPRASPRSEFGKREAHFRVPFLLLAPGVVTPQVVERPASQVDIAPTILELMAYRAPNAFVGQSLLRAKDTPASPVVLVGVNSASIILDDERCMASHETCLEKSLPRCVEGQSPEATTHVCYSQSADLLFSEDIGLKRLNDEDAARVKGHLQTIKGIQTHLESHDRLGAGPEWRARLNTLSSLIPARKDRHTSSADMKKGAVESLRQAP